MRNVIALFYFVGSENPCIYSVPNRKQSYELYIISDNGHKKYSYPSLDTPFEESMGIGYSKIDREIPIELDKEIPICVKIGTSSNRMEVLDITEDFRKIECDAGIAVTITVFAVI